MSSSLTTRLVAISLTTFVAAVFLNGCTREEPIVLPTGPQTLTGALSPVDLSLTRRGTDVLRQNGRDVYYVESSVVNLRAFAGMDVSVTGTLEFNTDTKALPVLVATQVTRIEQPSHPWTIPALKLTFSAPLAWTGDVFDDGIRFTQTGSLTPLLTINRSSLASLPSGTPLVVGSQRAVRVSTASGVVVYVQNGPDVIAISLDKSLSDPAGKEPVQSVLQLLKTLVFTASQSSIPVTSSGSFSGTPCGGPAGILCAAGSYCAITDTSIGSGVCRPLGR